MPSSAWSASRAYREALDIDTPSSAILDQVGKAFDRRVVVALINYLDNHGGRAQWAGRPNCARQDGSDDDGRRERHRRELASTRSAISTAASICCSDCIELIAADAARMPARTRRVLVYIGDYIDRGPDSAGVLDLLLDRPLPGFEIVHLLGNHEDILLQFPR